MHFVRRIHPEPSCHRHGSNVRCILFSFSVRFRFWAHLDTTTKIRGSAKRNAAFTPQHGAMLTPRQPEGCVPVVEDAPAHTRLLYRRMRCASGGATHEELPKVPGICGLHGNAHPFVAPEALHAGCQSNNFNCSDLDPLYSLICGTKARSKFPAGNASLSQFHQTASHTVWPSVIHSFACCWSRPMRCAGRCNETFRTAS